MRKEYLVKDREEDSGYNYNNEESFYYFFQKNISLLDGNSQSRYNDILDRLRKDIEMKRRSEVEKHHKFAISKLIDRKKDGGERIRFRTFLPDENGKKGKQIIRNDRDEIIDVLMDYYGVKEEAASFDDVYKEWCDHYFILHNSSSNTKFKYHTDYNRFFENDQFIMKAITDITDADIEEFFLRCITKDLHRLTYKAFTRLYGYVDGTFKRAFKLRIIDKNPMDYIDKKDFRDACRDVEEKTADTELISDDHFAMILDQLYKDINNNPTYFAPYAVELAALTGMRVAELATLKWEDIDLARRVIIISRSDKDNRVVNEDGTITHKWTVEKTKTKKKRMFPIDEDVMRSIKRIQNAHLQNNIQSEWLFPHKEYGWTRSSIISSCLKNKCLQLKLGRTYGIHAFRKTLNSDMRMNNAPAKMCASMLGNTPEVNDQHYYYDTSNIDEKLRYVEEAHKKRSFA